MTILRSIEPVLGIVGDLANDGLLFLRSTFRSRTSLIAENLFLRKQLAFYQEHQIKPRRLTDTARLSLIFWSRFFEWKSALLSNDDDSVAIRVFLRKQRQD